MSKPNRRNVFISYAREDKHWRDAFEGMLAPACERGIIGVWTDADIEAGEDWSKNIDSALQNARIGLLLVTDNFLKSEFITKVEMAAFLAEAARGDVSIRWVPISASLYVYSDLAGIQAAWDPERPLASLEESEQKVAIQKICLEIVEHFGSQSTVSEGRRGSLRAKVESRLSDRYVITDELATGKLSVVYRAERKHMKRQVVVKALVASELDDWARRAFIDGVMRAFHLASPAFIKVLDHFMDEAPECLISEFITGERLSNFTWRNAGGLPLPQVKSILLELASAIEEAHRRGWRRGELCLSDILMDESGIARISPIDFTNVLREEGEITGNFLVDRESLAYMTPERFFGRPPSLLSDQYSLGLIARELLSGSKIPRVVHPRDMVDKPELFAYLESGKGAWTKRSPEFSGVVSRMLRQDPAERWPSMTDVRNLIAEIEVEPDERHRKIATASYLRLQANVQRLREFFRSFYGNFFESAGDLRGHFESIDMERQYNLLNQSIHTLLEFRSSSAGARNSMKELTTRHLRFGLTRSHYKLFVDTFVKTIEQFGVSDPAELTAWRESLQPGIDFMCLCQDEQRTQASEAELVKTRSQTV